MKGRILDADRAVVLAADVPNIRLPMLMKAIQGLEGIGAVKLGMSSDLSSLAEAVQVVRMFCPELKVVYDRQKGGTDIPPMGEKFAAALKEIGVDAAILFPLTGPETQHRWTKACTEAKLPIIIGGMMTHPKFLASEGGYVDNNAPTRIFVQACQEGVRNFVVPGNRLEWAERLCRVLGQQLGDEPRWVWPPGLITQGGSIGECGRVVGNRYYAIVGSAIYDKETPDGIRAAAVAAVAEMQRAR